MPTDKLEHGRAKSRLIMELRYSPLVKVFDNRGSILDLLNRGFSAKMPHWQAENVAVRLFNNPESPTQLLFVDHMRSVLIYEDPGSLTEFYDDGKKFIKLLLQEL